MSYPTSSQAYSSPAPASFYSTPPPPPPKSLGYSSPPQGPPPPPLPPGQIHSEASELEANITQVQYIPQQQPQHAPSLPHVPPIEANWLPEMLKDKTTTDLHQLLQDPDLLAAILSNPNTTHPSLPAAENAVKPLLEGNLSLATSLEQVETQLSQKRAQVQARLLALRALEQQHRSKITETEKALNQFSPMALYQRLSASVQEQEQLVRGIEESWLDEAGVASEREVSDFVRRLREARKVEFLRRERKERWDEGRVGGWR